jgi:hypothetical protein
MVNPVVGCSLTGLGIVGRDHVVVTAVFVDGYSQEILDVYV